MHLSFVFIFERCEPAGCEALGFQFSLWRLCRPSVSDSSLGCCHGDVWGQTNGVPFNVTWFSPLAAKIILSLSLKLSYFTSTLCQYFFCNMYLCICGHVPFFSCENCSWMIYFVILISLFSVFHVWAFLHHPLVLLGFHLTYQLFSVVSHVYHCAFLIFLFVFAPCSAGLDFRCGFMFSFHFFLWALLLFHPYLHIFSILKSLIWSCICRTDSMKHHLFPDCDEICGMNYRAAENL